MLVSMLVQRFLMLEFLVSSFNLRYELPHRLTKIFVVTDGRSSFVTVTLTRRLEGRKNEESNR